MLIAGIGSKHVVITNNWTLIVSIGERDNINELMATNITAN